MDRFVFDLNLSFTAAADVQGCTGDRQWGKALDGDLPATHQLQPIPRMFYSTQEKSQTNATNVNMHPLESTPWRKVKQMPKYTATPTLHVLFNNPNKDNNPTHYPLLLPIIMLPLVTTVHSLIIIASKNIIKPKHILHISPVNVAYVLCHNKIKVQLLESVHKVTSFLFFCRVQYFFCDGLVTTPSGPGGSCEISPCPHYHQHHHHYVKVTRNICLLDLKKDFKTRQKNINVSEFR